MCRASNGKEGIYTPIYEFACSEGHRFEKLMTIAEGERITQLICEGPCGVCVQEVADGKRLQDDHGCGQIAKRVEFSTFSPHFAPGGAGGFHKPNTAKIVGRADVTKHINNVTGGKGLHGLVKGGSTARVEGK